MVRTVDRGLRLAAFWSIDTAGDSPSMKSTSGLSICPRNWRAYADRDSTYRRWPSAKMVSNARLDFPEPDSPVNTIMESLGRSSDTSLRLCSRAPPTTRRSATAFCFLGHLGTQPTMDTSWYPGVLTNTAARRFPPVPRPGIRRVPSPACHAVGEDCPGYGKRDGPAGPRGSAHGRGPPVDGPHRGGDGPAARFRRRADRRQP